MHSGEAGGRFSPPFGPMSWGWPGGRLRDTASDALSGPRRPACPAGLTLSRAASYLGSSCMPEVDAGLRGGTGRTGSEVPVSPSGLARWRSRSVNALMISGASKARFLRPTVIWFRTPSANESCRGGSGRPWFLARRAPGRLPPPCCQPPGGAGIRTVRPNRGAMSTFDMRRSCSATCRSWARPRARSQFASLGGNFTPPY